MGEVDVYMYMYNVHVGVHVHVWYMYVWRLALPFVIFPGIWSWVHVPDNVQSRFWGSTSP